MKPFSKNEVIATVAILLIITLATFFNLRQASRRARDAQRRADLGTIIGALESYHRDYGYFPASEDGKIKACKGEAYDAQLAGLSLLPKFDWEAYFRILAPCDWGRDGFVDLFDPKNPAYLKNFPQDPRAKEGISYLYFSNGKRFQIFAYMEGEKEETGYNASIVARGLACGERICNFGKSYGETPLDKSIEEYENELIKQQKAK